MSSVVDYIYGSSKVEAEVAPCQQYGPGNGGYVSSTIPGIPLCQPYGPGNGGYVPSNIPGIPLCQPYGPGNGGYVPSNIPGIPLCQPYGPGNGGYVSSNIPGIPLCQPNGSYFLSNTPGVPLCQQGIPLSPQYGHGNGGYVWSLHGDGIGGYVSSSIPYMLFPQLMDDHVECLLVARELFEQELFRKIQSEGEDFLTFESVSKTVLSKLNLRMKRIYPFEDEQFYIDIIEYHIRRLERVENIKAYYELMKLFAEKEYEKYGLYHEALRNLPSEDDQRVHEIVSSSVIYASDVLRHYLMDFVDKKDRKGLKKEEKLAALDSEKDMWIHRVRQGCLDCDPLPPWVYICDAHIHWYQRRGDWTKGY